MLLSDLMNDVSLKLISGTLPESFEGVYVGDLLSRAMSHVESGNLWITIMNNINVVAVASLTEASAVVLAEDVVLMPEAEVAAKEKGICILSSSDSAFELCCRIGALCAARE